ncbi:MAG: hypothetical protein ACTHJU_07865 [Sphingopyxis sp.]
MTVLDLTPASDFPSSAPAVLGAFAIGMQSIGNIAKSDDRWRDSGMTGIGI